MKISEFVDKLTNVIKEHGDVEVEIVKKLHDREFGTSPTIGKLHRSSLKTGTIVYKIVIE